MLDPLNSADGIITTQIFNAFNRTFTIKHGYPVQGIFKFDITVDDNLPFRFGAYGELGSDDNEIVTDIIINQVNFNIYYHKEQEKNYPIETFYSYVIPKKISENQAITYSFNRIQNDTEECLIISNEVTNGLLFYMSKTNDVIDWITNDLEIQVQPVQPVQTGGDPIICPLFAHYLDLNLH